MRRLAVITLVPLLALGAGCGGDDDDVNASGGGFCDRARALDAEMTALESQLDGDEMPSREEFDQTADAIGDLADDAPDEVKGDLETLAAGVREVADIFGEIDLNDSEALADPANAETLQEMSERMDALDESVGESSERVEEYLADECDIDIGDDGGSDVDDGTDGTDGSDGS